MGYERTDECKIVRRKHKITFRINAPTSTGTTAIDLMAMLKQVPDLATVDEVVTDLPSPDLVSIEFHEERQESGE